MIPPLMIIIVFLNGSIRVLTWLLNMDIMLIWDYWLMICI